MPVMTSAPLGNALSKDTDASVACGFGDGASLISVLLYIDSDIFAGTEAHILELARHLFSGQVHARIACPAQSPLASAARREEIEIVPIEKRGFVDVHAILQLRGLLVSGAVDVIHAHNGRTALATGLAMQFARRGAGIATQHFIDPSRATRNGMGGLASRAAHRWLNGQMAQTIAISQAARDAMLARRDAASERVTVIRNGISLPNTDRLTPPTDIRKELGVAQEAPLVVCAARLEQEKDVTALISAMSGVRATVANARCVICGEGSERGMLVAQIAALGLADCVSLVGFRDDALAVIRAADVFVLPSRAEPFGLVLLEAMALEKPVIAVGAGGPLEIVDPGRTGLLVPPRDPAALGTAIRRLLGDAAERAEMGQKGRRRYEEHFTAAAMASATADVYREAATAVSNGRSK